jgi:NADH-quinone oxidoreductase subunit N
VIAIAGCWMLFSGARGSAYGGAYVQDDFALVMKIITLVGSAVTLIMSAGYAKAQRYANFEYPVLVTLSTLGMMLMISANSTISLYLGFELQSLALYVVAAINRENARSSEAGLKYFVLGALGTGMMLYGISLTYGYTGSVDFGRIAAAVSGSERQLGVLFGLIFILAGLTFKISAVPFHMWTPDVYEGAPTPITALFATAPKVAAMALIVRTILIAFPGAFDQWQQIIVVMSILSMLLGAFAAIGQKNIKRMMAYSSIGHMGYALIGLAAGTQRGVEGVLIYMLIYLAMDAGAFACILAMRRQGEETESIADLSGLSRTHPRLAFVMATLMFSLAGIPPLAGFFAKFYVFMAAIDAHLYVLAVIGVVTSVVGAYYYLNIVRTMYFDDPAPAFDKTLGPGLSTVMTVCGLFMFVFVVIAAPLLMMASTAASALLP